MAYKRTGTAGKSASGASMSRYDVEVEERLQKLEAAVAALQTHQHDTPTSAAPTGLAAGAALIAKEDVTFEEKLDHVVSLLASS